MIADLIVAALLLAGGFFALVAAVGVARLPDVFIRMHASTKAGTLGGGLILAAVAVAQWEAGVTTRVVLIIAFLLVTAPIAAHLIGRAAYRIGVPLWHNTVVDEWQHDRPAAPAEPPARAPAAPPYGPPHT